MSEQEPRRCAITRNPVGTDTKPKGQPCYCCPCVDDLAERHDRLVQENEQNRNLAMNRRLQLSELRIEYDSSRLRVEGVERRLRGYESIIVLRDWQPLAIPMNSFDDPVIKKPTTENLRAILDDLVNAQAVVEAARNHDCSSHWYTKCPMQKAIEDFDEARKDEG